MNNKTYVGIKLTHDGGVAAVRDGKLLFSVEMEKINDNPRYSEIGSLEDIFSILKTEGVDPKDCEFCIDGWHSRKELGVGIAGYSWDDRDGDARFHHSQFGHYRSCVHIESHLYGTHLLSPHADEETYILLCDGGNAPELFVTEGEGYKFIARLSKLTGLFYRVMGFYRGPYKEDWKSFAYSPEIRCPMENGRHVPGKIMSFMNSGEVDYHMLRFVADAYEVVSMGCPETSSFRKSYYWEHLLCQMAEVAFPQVSDEDWLTTMHTFFQRILLRGLAKYVPKNSNLIFTGGSALNIKWNSAIRKVYPELWVPPFPNDAGSAIGAAAYAHRKDGGGAIEWSAYSGPELIHSEEVPGWASEEMTPFGLGVEMARLPDSAFVVLEGRSEVGPRALGHRSLMMNPTSQGAKGHLNDIKGRESFRPVAPIVLEEDAYELFGTLESDEYMIFDHRQTPACRRSHPALSHSDYSARIQTVSADGNQFVRDILLGFKSMNRYGCVCNTSANGNGTGFFPSTLSACAWAESKGVQYVYSNRTLFTKIETK